MATDTMIVMAYRHFGDPARQMAYEYTRGWYERLGWPMVINTSENGRPAALNAAVRSSSVYRATKDLGGVPVNGRTVIVQVDPDSLVPITTLLHAVDIARVLDGLVVPHDNYRYLTESATLRVLAGDLDPFRALADDDVLQSGQHGVGNVTVFTHSTWARSRGYDERFTSWGGDDAAFAMATDAFCSPMRRLRGDMVHLWHPPRPESDPNHPEYLAQMSLLGQYRDAAAVSREAVRQLVTTR